MARAMNLAPAFIAADIGGTHSRIGLVRAGTGRSVELLHSEHYRGREWPGLPEILADFIGRFAAHGGQPVRHAALACAGYLNDDAVINDNLPWPLPLAPLRERLGLQRVEVINDFEAAAHAVAALEPAALRSVIEPPRPASPGGPIVVMGPGTGLGCAFVLPGTDRDPRRRVLPTEAGHAGLAVATMREAAVMREVARDADFAEAEHALCGPGLLRLYRAIARLDAAEAPLQSPAEVTRAAIAGHDAVAVEALDMFCALLGGVAADLATVARASGGVVLAGGIAAQIDGFLKRSRFAERFLRRGVMRPFLEQVPVRLVDHGDFGVIGAARWSLAWGAASDFA
ncbi:MAG TPA: glucokinase [Methylibium sp.]|uniref:glucokinase n=1 Tax=Methylibium sp. TaxID=2067992 RepID=UPI002DB65CCE|nr:glucokinase [Methylibium sp.]HEU4459556.1 glucokinase [Methylibium sp.]